MFRSIGAESHDFRLQHRCETRRYRLPRAKRGSADGSGFSDPQKEQVLREQHRLVLNAIRDGLLETVLDRQDSREALAAIRHLDVHWLNADAAHSEHVLFLRMRVTDDGTGVEGARLTVRFARPDAAPFYTQVLTDAVGDAEMKIDVDESQLPDSSVLVQASYSGRTATRKFQLRKVEVK
jgi:hypothetical protein